MSPAPPQNRPRLAVLDALRGMAALWVGLYHFTQNGEFNQGFPADQPLKTLGTWGWLGVYAFFVISGFILPWTMAKGGYRLRDFGRFLGKRLLRLHPLYLLSVGVMILPLLVMPAVPQAGAAGKAATWGDWWPHFFYLNGLMDRPWLMDIYWTLALEAQYYLAVGLLFPLLAHRKGWVRRVTVAALILLPLAGHDGSTTLPRTAMPFSALFAMGILIFLRMSGRAGKYEFRLALLACAAVTWKVLGAPQAVTALASAVIILAVPLRHPALIWLGTVSYPFYLFHLVAGGLLIPLFCRLPRGPWVDTAAVLILMAVSLILSALLHRWVERPAQRWSSAIRYRRH